MFYTYQAPDPDVLAYLQNNIAASNACESNYEIPVPPGLEYLPYQKAGIEFGIRNAGVLIADEPGLGKTIQAIGIINKDTNMKKILIVCPATLKINWLRELRKWLTRFYSISIADSALAFCSDIVIINYEQVSKYQQLIHTKKWDMLIADECHLMRNRNTLRARYIVGYPEENIPPVKAARRILLTGTPILNRAKELWALISYLNPKVWSSYDKFAQQFCQKQDHEFGDYDDGSSNLDTLQTQLRATVMIRRRKADVLKQLPPKFREIVEIQTDSRQTLALIEQEHNLVYNMQQDLAAAENAAKAAYDHQAWQEYEQILNHFHTTKKHSLGEISRVRHQIALEKVPMVIAYINDTLECTDKVVVFAHHQDVISSIAQAFGNSAVIISGNQSLQAKQDAIDSFQNQSNIKVCVASILAAGTGITLTASHHVLFAELDWVPANVTQAEDRCHRISQTQPVIVKHLILNNSLDVKIAQKIIAKQKIYEEALNQPQ